MTITLNINGSKREIDAAPDTPLLWVIRDNIELTGTKYGCGVAQCGACTVHLNGQPIRSCVTPIAAVAGQRLQRQRRWAVVQEASLVGAGFHVVCSCQEEASFQVWSCQEGASVHEPLPRVLPGAAAVRARGPGLRRPGESPGHGLEGEARR